MDRIVSYLKQVQLISIAFLFCSVVGIPSRAQVRWKGQVGDGLWTSPGNWVGNVLPTNSDEVILDNSIVPDAYTVTLPGGTQSVIVRSLTIKPAPEKTIEVILPVTNTAVPGFVASGTAYGLEIYGGGIFRNASGASAGTSVDVADSISISGGGRYIHNTSRAHAANVTVLSRRPGTETGTFEFDVPGGAGYTVSIAGRVYGNLVLSANAAGGSKSYTSTGTTTLNVKGDFRLNGGVSYSLLFSGEFVVHHDFIHQGIIFDVSGGTANNRISCRGNVTVDGIFTETGNGLPVLEFAGTEHQAIRVAGSFGNNVVLRLNNSSGFTLQSPLVVPASIEFIKGKLITSAENILVFADGAISSSASDNSFVEGPIRKIGDDDFEFPVGKQGNYAPLSLTGGGSISDEFEAEYLLANPLTSYGKSYQNPPILRVSSLEYWRVEQRSGTAMKRVVLNVRTYSDATLLEKLVVTRWDESEARWKNEGNTSFSGIATGTITSVDVNRFGIFTVASTVAEQNPLPLSILSFEASKVADGVNISWQIDSHTDTRSFEILRSHNGIHFDLINTIYPTSHKFAYRMYDPVNEAGTYYYKLRVWLNDGHFVESVTSIVHFSPTPIAPRIKTVFIRNDNIHITFANAASSRIKLIVFAADGRVVRELVRHSTFGDSLIQLSIPALPTGVYYVAVDSGGRRLPVVRAVKW